MITVFHPGYENITHVGQEIFKHLENSEKICGQFTLDTERALFEFDEAVAHIFGSATLGIGKLLGLVHRAAQKEASIALDRLTAADLPTLLVVPLANKEMIACLHFFPAHDRSHSRGIAYCLSRKPEPA